MTALTIPEVSPKHAEPQISFAAYVYFGEIVLC